MSHLWPTTQEEGLLAVSLGQPSPRLTLQHPGRAGWQAGGGLGGGRSGFWARPGSLLLDPGYSLSEPRGTGPQSQHLQNGVRRVPCSGGWSGEWLRPAHTRSGTQRGALQCRRTDLAHMLDSVFLASLRISLMNKSNDASNHMGSSPHHSLVAQSREVLCP